ncbi:hypothetical protein, partial [Burkholderia vietnamiensis]|uniref:hypothetical protein n=1 Tax=Burkholderia vietnamiensis TaxID=60552 RepID=UPI002DD43D5B
RYAAHVPDALRAPGLPGKTWLPSCSWLDSLKNPSLHKIRCGSSIILSQIGIGIHVFLTNPVKGIVGMFVPFYLWAYARRERAGRVLIQCWYAGLAALTTGVVLAS